MQSRRSLLRSRQRTLRFLSSSLGSQTNFKQAVCDCNTVSKSLGAYVAVGTSYVNRSILSNY